MHLLTAIIFIVRLSFSSLLTSSGLKQVVKQQLAVSKFIKEIVRMAANLNNTKNSTYTCLLYTSRCV